MAKPKKSSYRLSQRLNASRRSRLNYITYLNSGAGKKPAEPEITMLFAQAGSGGNIGYSSFSGDEYGDLKGPQPLETNNLLALIKLPGGGNYGVFDGDAVGTLKSKVLELGGGEAKFAEADTLTYNGGTDRTQVFFADDVVNLVPETEYPIAISQLPTVSIEAYVNGGGSVYALPTAVPNPVVLGAERWRILVESVQSNVGWDTTEIGWFEADNVRLVPGGGVVASASSFYPGNGVELAYDGLSTRFSTDFSGTWPQWHEINFGAGNPKQITKITIGPGESDTRTPKDYKFQYWNGSAWVTTDSFTGAAPIFSTREYVVGANAPAALISAYVDGGGSIDALPTAIAPAIIEAYVNGGGDVTAGVTAEVLITAYVNGGGDVTATVTAVNDAYTPTNTEAATLYSAMTVAPSNNRKTAIDTLIGTLKSSTVWAKLTGFYVFYAHDAQAARLNWKTPAQAATVRGAPVFTANDNYKSIAGDNGLVAPHTPASGFGGQNNAALFYYTKDFTAYDDAFDIGLAGSPAAGGYVRRISDNTFRGFLNAATSFNLTPVTYPGSGGGLVCISRSAAAVTEGFINGTKQGSTSTIASTTPPTGINSLGLLGSYNGGVCGGSTRPQLAAGYGSALTAAEQTTLKNALETYFAAAA